MTSASELDPSVLKWRQLDPAWGSYEPSLVGHFFFFLPPQLAVSARTQHHHPSDRVTTHLQPFAIWPQLWRFSSFLCCAQGFPISCSTGVPGTLKCNTQVFPFFKYVLHAQMHTAAVLTHNSPPTTDRLQEPYHFSKLCFRATTNHFGRSIKQSHTACGCAALPDFSLRHRAV